MKLLKIAVTTLSVLAASMVFAGETEDLINKAEASRQKAAKVGFEWTNTGKLIKKAKAAAKKGDNKLAMKLAKKAIKQGENSVLQAEYADKHWQESVPK